DGDGDLDAFVGNYGQNRLHLNGGTGVFTDVTATNLPALLGNTNAVALGDVDGDDDLDAFVGNGTLQLRQQNRLYTNLTRQVAWRGIPRVGKPLTLDVRGPAWGAWFLGFSLGTANVPIPPLGTLRLDPASIGFALAGLLDARGRASVTYPVPGNPSLVGATVYWQAVVASPAKLTNLEVTILTNL
ncbi:MAG: FG-GAP-like repeat-containing protein, partial [Planctomycetes bacterium]|nr:FG-GAP-like repeat-containing protein [Planctomycetota bacterium]